MTSLGLYVNAAPGLWAPHLLGDLGLLLQGQRDQFMPNAVLLVAVRLRNLEVGNLR